MPQGVSSMTPQREPEHCGHYEVCTMNNSVLRGYLPKGKSSHIWCEDTVRLANDGTCPHDTRRTPAREQPDNRGPDEKELYWYERGLSDGVKKAQRPIATQQVTTTITTAQIDEIERLFAMPEHAMDEEDYQAQRDLVAALRTQPAATPSPDAVLDAVLDELRADLETRFISSSNNWSKGRNSGLIECCNIIDEHKAALRQQRGERKV